MKELKLLFSIFAIGLLTSSCSILKNIRLVKAGEVVQEAFYQVIDFEERKGYIIITAEIRGNEYRFVLDSGAPNVISRSMLSDLGLDIESSVPAFDSQGNRGKLDIVVLDTICLGDLAFTNMSASVIETDSIIELYCLSVDGLIGANLMKHAIWEINYEEEKIIITDDPKKLDGHDSGLEVAFTTSVQGSPYIHIHHGDLRIKNVLVDLGSGGSLSIPHKSFKKIIQSENIKPLQGYGSSSYGIFGRCIDSSYSALSNQVHLGSMPMDSMMISTTQYSKRHAILGTYSLKNYPFIIDWPGEKIIFKSDKARPRELESYGFGFGLENNGLFVWFVYDDSPAGKAGIRVGTQILSINGRDVSDLDVDDYCEIRNEKLESDILFLKVKEGENLREVELRKEFLYK